TASRIAAAVHTNRLFCLNILASEYPHVAERFSGSHDAFISDRFDGIEFRQEGTQWLILREATAFACEISDTIVSGSHTVFVGNVLAIQTSDGQPLTYLQGRYRQLTQDQAASSPSSS
ncbi:MAG TPA: flavin reductase family protein, partial [Nordella sp.]|nr:flavin reductase family protein [Nordella sp.]